MSAALESDVREYSWRVTQGTRERLIIPVFRDGVAYDVTGWTVDAVIRAQAGGTLYYRWPTDLVDVTGSEVTLTIPAPVSSAWDWTRGWYRVTLSDPSTPTEDPDAWRVLQGEITIDPE